jgi:hypothetical protein
MLAYYRPVLNLTTLFYCICYSRPALYMPLEVFNDESLWY